MVRIRYPGFPDPAAEMERLFPLRQEAIRMMLAFKPQSPEYLALFAVAQTCDAAAGVVAGDPQLYLTKTLPNGQRGRR